MLILIKNKALISGLNKKQILQIQEKLTINNPLFHRKAELGLALWGIPSSLKYYEIDPSLPDQIIIPIGALPTLLNDGILNPNPEDLIDQRTVGQANKYFSNLVCQFAKLVGNLFLKHC